MVDKREKLLINIEMIRLQLNELIKNEACKEDILRLSCKLDEAIIQYYDFFDNQQSF